MSELFKKRSRMQPDDTLPILDKHPRARLWTDWCNDRLLTELTDKQRWTKRSNHTSIFNEHMKKSYGQKYFVFGIFQTGVTWVSRGSANEVADSFVAWVRALFSAIANANDRPEYRHAQQRSGNSRGQHGLTPAQFEARDARDRALRYFNYARHVQALLCHSKGTSKKTGKRKHGAADHTPKSLSRNVGRRSLLP